MRRKTLIVIALITVMLFSCITPTLQAQAATEKTTMSFNSALYKGLKLYFQEQGISAIYNDGLHTIKMENSLIAEIEELSLKEKGISDITGLTYFTGIKSLVLSGNDLDEESNLEILNEENFPNLVYLDLSSNQISDISKCQPLVEKLIKANSSSVNLTGQVVKQVTDVELDAGEEVDTVYYSLPQILKMAGIATADKIKNQGQLEPGWINVYNVCSSESIVAPYISKLEGDVPSDVYDEEIEHDANEEDDDSVKIRIHVGDNQGTIYQGLVKVVISIKDTTTASISTNPSSENILKDSIFTLYYVVHSVDSEAVIFKDNNFYKAVKDQLTKNQTINNELISYNYVTTESGDLYYDLCDVELSGTTAILKINGEVVYTITNFNYSGYDGRAVIYKGASTSYIDRYALQYYEIEYVDTINPSGVVTKTLKVKVLHYNSDARNLYVDSYDELYTLVIKDSDIVNKITSLILNDKRINDLSGLEKFIGLESGLNVSYNYINTLAKIYGLQLNKDGSNTTIQEAFKKKREAMNAKRAVIVSAYKTAEDKVEAIKVEIEKIEQAIIDYDRELREALDIINSSTDLTEEQKAEKRVEKQDALLKKYSDMIANSQKTIVGDGTSENTGLIGELNKALDEKSDSLNVNISYLYNRLQAMYNSFNKEYKLTSLLTKDLNYETEEEYEALIAKLKSRDTARSLVEAEVSRIATFENTGALSSLDKDLIESAFGLVLDPEEQNPISKALTTYVNNLKEAEAPRTTWLSIINKFEEINIYSQTASYCLLERMNNSIPTGACYAEKYLGNKVKDFEYEGITPDLKYDGINTQILTGIYEKISKGSTSYSYTSSLYRIFATYEESIRSCESGTAYACVGPYLNVERLNYETETETALGVNYISSIKLTEDIKTVGKNEADLFFFKQLIALANKFAVVDEVNDYVVLPNLKRIDVRNNEIETLGTIFVTDKGANVREVNLTTLKDLKEFYAGHNIITGNIENTEYWNQLTSLKKLDLSYNYITDILPLQNLKNLRYLDVSDNLLEGEFKLKLSLMPKLKNLKLAGNKFTDISQIIKDYNMLADGDLTSYFAREDTLNLDLSRQELEIDITDAIAYSTATIHEVELPPIFAQLELIDAERTAYGTTSSKGTITARGGYAYIPVSKTGEYVGVVKVIAANGYPEDVTTSFGIDSTCTIKYSVKNIKVNSVNIAGEDARIEVGTSKTFTATVEGENVPDTTVEWDILSEHAEGTTIDKDGVLTIAEDETATELTIEATSNYDDSISDTLVLEVYKRTITDINIEGPEKIVAGKSGEYIAEVIGTDLEEEDKTVTWSVFGRNTSGEEVVLSEDTTISPNGELTVGSSEEVATVIIRATSEFDPTVFGTLTVTISRDDSSLPGALGYTIDDDDDIIDVSPDTSCESFKAKYVTDSNYTVKVTRDGVEIGDNTPIGTGDIVSILKDGIILTSNEVIVKGDVNGDGTVSAVDSKLVKSHRARLTTLTGIYFKAADIDGDEELTISDVRLILAHRARIDGYIL